MLDVAAVAARLLTTHSPRALRRRLLALVPGDEAASLRLLLFVVALHDIGKFTPAFQAKVDWARRLLPLRGFDLNPPTRARHHGAAGLVFARDALRTLGIAPADALARAVTAHHGEFPFRSLLVRGRLERPNAVLAGAVAALGLPFPGRPHDVPLSFAQIERRYGL